MEPDQRWWPALARGLVTIGFGALALFWPAITLSTLVVVFGLYAIADGLLTIIGSWRDTAPDLPARVFHAVLGTIGLAAGITTLAWSGIPGDTLAWLIAFWAYFTGVLEVAAALSTTSGSPHFGRFSALSGGTWVLLGLLMAFLPNRGAPDLAYVIGALAVLRSVVLLVVGAGGRPEAEVIDDDPEQLAAPSLSQPDG